MRARDGRSLGAAVAVALLLAGLLSGCAMRTSVVRSTMNPIIDGTFEAMMAETDLVVARSALEANLVLVEGLIRSDPTNNRLPLVAAQGFTAYTLGFVEDTDPERAAALYLRGRAYANRWLVDGFDTDLLAIDRLDEFKAAVAALPDEALPGIFWLGNSWASAIMLNLTDIASISGLPRVEALMQRVIEINENYYFAGAHLFFGGYYGARPLMLGGDPDQAREHLNRQIELTDGQVLLGHVFMVKYVHLAALDGEAAETMLEQVLAFDISTAPENTRLVNRIAQAKAAFLLEHLEEYL